MTLKELLSFRILGGMIEQQVLFKKCILSVLVLLANNILDRYLKEDVTNGTMDSFYTQRRQLTLDHRLGGNSIIRDRAAWIGTIASNPALLKIDRYIPWSDAVTDNKIKKNLEKAVRDRLNRVAEKRKAQESQNPNALGLGTIDVSFGLTLPNIVWNGWLPSQDGYKCATIGPVALNTSAMCGNGCDVSSLLLTDEAWKQYKNLFTLERNKSTGSFRLTFKDYDGKYFYGLSELRQ